MSNLMNLVIKLNKEEVRFFKLFISRTQDSSDRKDLMLFDYIRKSGSNYNEDYILDKLYKQKNKNAFYRLKNRLMQDINTSLYLQHYDKDNETYIYHLLAMSKFYYNRGEEKLCLSFLSKAELKAEMNQKFELLELIYTEYVKYSLEFTGISVDDYMLKRKENTKQLNEAKQISEVLAAISFKLKTTKDLSTENKPIFLLLKEIIDEVLVNSQLKNSIDLKLRIYETVSKILMEKRDYKTLEIYLLTLFLQFDEDGVFDKKTHHIKLQMLSGFIETLYNNKKYDRALSYVSKLKESMQEYNGLLYDDYLFTFHNSLVKNYSAIDQLKAIEILENLKKDNEFSQIADFEIYIYLSLAIIWFEKKDYHKAIANIYKLYMYDSYTKTGVQLKYKAVVTELIVRFELGDFEYIDYRVKQLKEEFKDFLAMEINSFEKEFLEILKLLAKQEGQIKTSDQNKRVKQFPNNVNQKFNEIRFVNYYNWLNKLTF